ncbi:MAG: ABC transporter ATP-binding protein [Alphaproteobacteria bacterium]|nr:ABC transporter ATP-binding protein [Alphaproteobacteria bacterium]
MLELKDVKKTFGAVRAVDGVSFGVDKGAMAGLIGPNGAGKTTLFNTLAGVHRPDSGRISLDGRRIDGLEPHHVFKTGLCRTFQIPRPFPAMTVLENVMLVPERQAGEWFWNNWFRTGRVRMQEQAIREQAAEIIGFCGLEPVISDLAGTLSGGQLKLLELARVLMADPKIILLDEPAAGVNPTLLETLIDKLIELNREGRSFLIIEHNIEMVMALCDPVMVMAAGRLIFEGAASDARQDQAVLDAYLGDLPS